MTCSCSKAQPCGYHAQLRRDQAAAYAAGWRKWGESLAYWQWFVVSTCAAFVARRQKAVKQGGR